MSFNDVSPIAARPKFGLGGGGGVVRDVSSSFEESEEERELSLADALRDLSRDSIGRPGVDTPQSKKKEYSGIGLSHAVKVHLHHNTSTQTYI